MTEQTPTPAKPKPPAKSRKVMLVRFGRMKTFGVFEHEEAHIPKAPTRVVVKTERGLEMGEIVGSLTGYKEGRYRFTEEQVCGYYANSEITFSGELSGKFIRFATPDDISEQQHLERIADEEIACCEKIAKDLGLRMKIVGAEHIFGGERIVFYFMAEGRIDFRELVRHLAQEYQTRIEMRQIGSRDEAKLLGDIETCGQECCCLRFLQLLKPVNMRMAKMQKATLDPSKISGYCGRLKCCLRYEDELYVDLKKRLPRKNAWVQTKRGEGKVVDGQILTQLVVIELEGGEREAFPLEEVTILPGPPVRPERPPESGNGRPQEQQRDQPPRDSQRRDSQPRDSQQRDSQPRDSQQRDSQPRDPQQRDQQQQRSRRPRRHGYDNRRNRNDRNNNNADRNPNQGQNQDPNQGQNQREDNDAGQNEDQGGGEES
jgi:cell fate regulator YaaT (PSP1 superfamily)